MTSDFWQLTVDASQPAVMAAFWAEALGYQVSPPAVPQTVWNEHYRRRFGAAGAPDRIFDPQGLRPAVWFQQGRSRNSAGTVFMWMST